MSTILTLVSRGQSFLSHLLRSVTQLLQHIFNRDDSETLAERDAATSVRNGE